MDGNDVSADHVIAELIEMGFEYSLIMEAIGAVGPSLNNAIEFILNGSNGNSGNQSKVSENSTSNGHTSGKSVMSTSHARCRTRQPSIMEHLQSSGRHKRRKTHGASSLSISVSEMFKHVEEQKAPLPYTDHDLGPASKLPMTPVYRPEDHVCGSDWEQRVNNALIKHFGFSCLKIFQKEALEAWLAHQDCLVLAATGSGKSLCFQIPAILSGKVVVVISPLISLMHDQCLKLAKHGVSACFLGSGQSDGSVEQKAMNGMYGIIYVCPETVLRLIGPLQRLAENHGIALFAIDEVHCVSKWGHDFRPDYRRLSVLRENFTASKLKFLKFDIPLMALTATATIRVREDIVKSLCMSEEAKIVLTSFFRPNLRFSVNHSRTSSESSYEKDFRELIDTYTRKRIIVEKENNAASCGSENNSDNSSGSDADEMGLNDSEDLNDDYLDGNGDGVSSVNANVSAASMDDQLSVEYLEDGLDTFQSVNDLDVACGEFSGKSPGKDRDVFGSFETLEPPTIPEECLQLQKAPLEQGSTIIYVPTRKETLQLAKFLCSFGVKAAAYNAKLPRAHLRRVHEEFHQNVLQVVVATIAFGMGIDKSNVRRIIHYGWPQSLEAYYQEAGRAGRDGKLADCVLYANLSRIPSLLPSQRTDEQTKLAYKMLSDCFRYGMNTACCRAKTLVKYFGEDFTNGKCFLCDICVGGPPQMENLKVEAVTFMQILATQYRQINYGTSPYDDAVDGEIRGRFMKKPNFRMVVSKIREQCHKFAASNQLWWRGLARILEDNGYIKEGDGMTRVCIKFPEPTDLGFEFLQSGMEQPFCIYPEADMLLSKKEKSYSTFSEWGKGWADPEIRRKRLQKKTHKRRSRKGWKKNSSQHVDLKTVRGRLAAKLTNKH
ncbi:ATP-dependent DNA helicase Q-like SIM [Macadamia integrifolia]|uniref:ATP-dependent DNA helicase Q-like SIM n=1 Tax=Macadamia integrifolia TaxID=60698 RepID=UPI001C4F1BCF|nr:ATP-dependent DNA helicase Q-like SIM [Macadamia integrifolia]XP_042516619.1 ATP-dependent DNA helicase Q-like SIM [Macadamia integrifolia]